MKTVWQSSDSDIGFFTRRRKMSFVRHGSFRNFLNKISRRAAYFCSARRFLLFFNRSERRFFPMPSAPPCIFRTCPKPTILPCSFPARFSQAWLLTFPAVSGIINKRFKNAFSGCGAAGSARSLGACDRLVSRTPKARKISVFLAFSRFSAAVCFGKKLLTTDLTTYTTTI